MQILISIKKVIQEFLIFDFHIYIEFLHDLSVQLLQIVSNIGKQCLNIQCDKIEKFLDKTIVCHTD